MILGAFLQCPHSLLEQGRIQRVYEWKIYESQENLNSNNHNGHHCKSANGL